MLDVTRLAPSQWSAGCHTDASGPVTAGDGASYDVIPVGDVIYTPLPKAAVHTYTKTGYFFPISRHEILNVMVLALTTHYTLMSLRIKTGNINLILIINIASTSDSITGRPRHCSASVSPDMLQDQEVW